MTQPSNRRSRAVVLSLATAIVLLLAWLAAPLAPLALAIGADLLGLAVPGPPLPDHSGPITVAPRAMPSDLEGSNPGFATDQVQLEFSNFAEVTVREAGKARVDRQVHWVGRTKEVRTTVAVVEYPDFTFVMTDHGVGSRELIFNDQTLVGSHFAIEPDGSVTPIGPVDGSAQAFIELGSAGGAAPQTQSDD